MKSVTILFLFSCIFFKLNAQPLFPTQNDNPNWFVTNNTSQETIKYELIKDTVFCSSTWYKVKSSSNELFWIQVESQKVFIKFDNQCVNSKYLLYDFSLQKGDSIFCGNSNGIDILKAKVVSVDSVQCNTKKFKRLKLNFYYSTTSQNFIEMYWIEGIGCNLHPFYLLYDWNNKSTWYKLDSCLYNNKLVFDTENAVTTSIKVNIQNNSDCVQIYPNPSKNKILVYLKPEFKAKTIELFDFSGKLQNTYNMLNSNYLSLQLKAGIYVLRVSSDKEKIIQKVVIE
jgi:hypothetical protein